MSIVWRLPTTQRQHRHHSCSSIAPNRLQHHSRSPPTRLPRRSSTHPSARPLGDIANQCRRYYSCTLRYGTQSRLFCLSWATTHGTPPGRTPATNRLRYGQRQGHRNRASYASTEQFPRCCRQLLLVQCSHNESPACRTIGKSGCLCRTLRTSLPLYQRSARCCTRTAWNRVHRRFQLCSLRSIR